MTDPRETSPSGASILVLEDDVGTRAELRALLQGEGHRVLIAESGAAALELLAGEPVHLVVAALGAPGMESVTFLRRLRERDALVRILVCADRAPDEPLRGQLAQLAVQAYHARSDGPARLLLAVDLALRTHEQLADLHVAERLKTDLLANVSHEFRSPLNVIVGYLDLVREGTFGGCPPEVLAVIEKVRANATYLLELVAEFLDLAKVEAGAAQLHRERVPLAPLLCELGESARLLLRTKPVEVQLDVPDDLPAVAVDAAKLRVILQNLLSNAVKFTAAGHVRLSARALPEGRVAVRVSDTGPGIAPEHHEAIFDLFHQLHPSASAKEGVGLGLALARRFARLMGGEIDVESRLGEGSVFTLVLPAAGTRASPAHEHAA